MKDTMDGVKTEGQFQLLEENRPEDKGFLKSFPKKKRD